LLLVHEVFGLDAFMRSIAQRFVAQGFVVLLPDLYSREGLPGPASTEEDPAPEWPREIIRSAVASFPDRRVLADLEGGLAFLDVRTDVDSQHLAVLGFCMGGNYARMLGCHSRRLAAVVEFYGRLRYAELSSHKPMQPLEMLINLDVPYLGLFGGRDASIPEGEVRELESALDRFAKVHELRLFPEAGHGFANHLRGGHDREAARAAWARVDAFLDERLELDRGRPRVQNG
jgi:carboxymethylenebutenolidase